MATTLGDAVTIANVALRDRDGDSYHNDDKREAIRFVLGEFLRISQCSRKRETSTLILGKTSFDATEIPEFRPERLIRLRIGNKPLGVISPDEYLSKISHRDPVDIQDVSPTGLPTHVSFGVADVMDVYPTPDVSYDITFTYSEKLNDLNDDQDVINIPDEYIRTAVTYGVPAYLRTAGREDLIAEPLWMKFMMFAREIKRKSTPRITQVNLSGGGLE